jgi:epoxyqueuosine reductase
MMMGEIMLRALVKKRAVEIGFDLVGIAPVEAWADLKFSREWVERGFGGEMRYLENPKRDDPRCIMPSAKSVICVGIIYNAPLPYSVEAGSSGLGAGSREQEVNESLGHRVIEPLKEKDFPDGSMAPSLDGIIHPDGGPGQEPSRPVSNFQFPVSNPDAGPRGWISRYAWGVDYHDIMRAKLERLRAAVEAIGSEVETRVYVDTGPIVERAFARLSGIGWTGKNTCLINESQGSWFFLGVILTSLALAPDLPAPDRCGTCTACIEACPTHALVEPYVMDASRCIAYLNIELRGAIPEEFRPAIGANVVGCDICQDVCPWNGAGKSQKTGAARQNVAGGPRRTGTTGLPEFQPMQVSTCDGEGSFSLFNPPLESLASLSEKDFRRIFRRSPVKRVKYRGWLRNICVAMGNSRDSKFLPRLQSLREHSDPIVRQHAEWAIKRLAKTSPAAAKNDFPRFATHL